MISSSYYRLARSLLITCVIMISSFANISEANNNWGIETIDTAGDVGYNVSFAIDSSNKAHISYWDRTNNDLKYATNASGTWITTALDTAGNVGGSTSIAVDSNNHVHIAYLAQTDSSLKYATNAAGAWTTAIIDPAPPGSYYGMYTSIAIDSNEKIHISYIDYQLSTLRYITNQSGVWVATAIGSIGDKMSMGTSIAVDNNSKAHISFTNTLIGSQYATNSSGAWTIETIEASSARGGWIFVDNSNMVHIYYEGSGTHKYATNQSGSWVTSVIDYGGAVARDTAGKSHIAFDSGGLIYATNRSGAWATESVDTSAVFSQIKIAVDTTASVHIAYYDYTNLDLKYAKKLSLTCAGDFVPADFDVDGSDLAALIANQTLLDLATFAQNFGRSACQ